MAAPRSIEPLRRRVCSIIDIGTADDFISRGYDILYTLVILINLAVTIAYTFDEVDVHFIRIHLAPTTVGSTPLSGTWACRRESSWPPSGIWISPGRPSLLWSAAGAGC